jgi:hypothetical protein
MDDEGNLYAAHHANEKWGMKVYKLPVDGNEWELIAEKYHNQVIEIGFNDVELIDDKLYMRAFSGTQSERDYTVIRFDVNTHEIDTIGYPPIGTGRNYFAEDRDGNLIMSDQYGGRVNQGTKKWDEGGMWRYSFATNEWEDITRNLDQRNSTNGECCAGLGSNSQGITGSGDYLYVKTEHGLYRWNYDNDNWDKLFDAPYGSGAGFITHVGPQQVIFDQRFLDGYSYTVRAGKNSPRARGYRFASMFKDVFDTEGNLFLADEKFRTRLRSMYSFDGETFYGRFEVQERGNLITSGKDAGKYSWTRTDSSFYAKYEKPANPPKVSFNFTPQYSTYLGGEADDNTVAVEVSANKSIIIAGNHTQDDGETRMGQVLVYDETGKMLQRSSMLNGIVFDMDIDETVGTIAVITDKGVSVYNSDLTLKWQSDMDMTGVNEEDLSTARISVGGEGTVVALVNKPISNGVDNVITVFDTEGNELSTKTIPRSYATDLVVLDDNDKVFVSGFSNNTGTNSNGKSNPVQIAFVHGYDLNSADLNRTSVTWDYDADQLAETENMADTRIYRMDIGKDGKLYVVGESAGGNTIYRWNGLDLETRKLVGNDPYSQAWNTGSAHIGYVGRIDPVKGEATRGQMILARKESDNKGNTYRARSITADEEGNVYIGGTSTCCSVARSIRHIGGEPIGEYKGGESSLIILGPNFNNRLMWTPLLSADAPRADGGRITSIAVGHGVKA